jgi:MYXO-CTERM domain-containing protein
MLQRICLSVAGVVFGLSSVAHAEQFVLVDVSYTHSADTTKDSHYYTKPPADAPKDWTKPVDYSMGSVHIIVDVKTKPAGDTPTKFQVCFEGTPSYACTLQSPTYTTTGRVEWDSPFKDFWYESTVDWSQGTKQIPLILKDTNNGKPAGDPKYMPTDLHVQVTLVSPGAKFVAPPAAGSGGAGGAAAGAGGSTAGASGAGSGGRGGAGGRAGGAGSAGGQSAGGAGAGQGGNTGAAANGGAGAAASTPTAGKAAAGASAAGAAGSAAVSYAGAASPTPSGLAGTVATSTGAQTAQPNDGEDDSGCRTIGSGSRSNGALAVLVALGYVWSRRRRRENAGG